MASMNTVTIELDGKTCSLPIVVGTEGEKAIDISDLRSKTGYITLDDGYGNTGSCQSQITFIDGEKGILRYRGIPIEEVAQKATFIETAFLLIYGHLPTHAELRNFSDLLTDNQYLHEDMATVDLKPAVAEYKVAIIVGADRLKTEGANAFLKTLEEPPAKSVLILLTTERQRILETIVSRCLRLNFAGGGVRISPTNML